MLPSAFLSRPLAHRALHDARAGRIENSPSAIRAAIAHGYGIEIDVQLSSDGVAMVFHDYDLGRLTNQKGPIQQRTASQLGEITLTGGTDTIPSLEEVLAIIDGQTPLLIEIKDQDGAMGPNLGALERATAKALETYRGEVAVMSFNPHSVALMAELCPQIARGITTSAYDLPDWAPLPKRVCDHLRDIPDYDRVGACFISHEVSDLNRPRVEALKRQGAAILCWTVRSLTQDAQARKIAHNVTFEGYTPNLAL